MHVSNKNQSSDHIELSSEDIRIDIYRDSGSGGQHRNKTDSAVRILHFRTGIMVTATESRSQHVNREVALERLKSALLDRQLADAADKENSSRKDTFKESRSWTWCDWRDEVVSPNGQKQSMKQALKGNFRKILK